MTEGALDYARDHGPRFVEDLKELLRIPSISTLPEHAGDMVRAAGWLRDRFESLGIASRLIEGSGPPLVYGEWLEAPGAPTVLVYGHYDIQPVDPIDLWSTPPFEPTERAGNLYARGASDDKGQTFTFLCAAESLLKAKGSLPINVRFLLEGQEECGGKVVKEYVQAHGDNLQADFVQVADSGMYAPGIPTIETGLRGVVYTEVRAWGPAHDLHSGLYGGVAPNPLIGLAQVLADIKDRDGHVSIPGFYADVVMPPDSVLTSWRALPFDDAAFLRDEIGASQLVGETEFTPLERIWARPTLDVHGITGGFTGSGAKTVIPAEASAKISMRIVPNQRAERIFELFRGRVLELAPPGIQLDVALVHGDDPVLVPDDSVYVQTAREALHDVFGRPAVMGRSGGSIPIVGVFKEVLKLDTVLMGWGLPDDNLHAPNEKISLENFHRGIEATVRFWEKLGQAG